MNKPHMLDTDAMNTQMLNEIASAILHDAPAEICTTLEAVIWIRNKSRKATEALRELENISTVRMCTMGMCKEASSVSKAGVLLQ